MCMDFSYLRANEIYSQYWYRETANSEVLCSAPKKHSYRSTFSCDRDRVMYSSAFRRLASKTQVFNSQTGDNLRTRLTHTLEVSQISRTIASQLKLDEDLTEAIALGHDVGHTPFGHIGERTLNVFSRGEDKRQQLEGFKTSPRYHGFKHNQQSVRVLAEYSEGVKFSNYMLFGIREHSKLFWSNAEDVKFYNIYEAYCSYCDSFKNQYPAWSFEAYIVKWADEIAQRHHDIEDAFLQKIIPADEIVEKVKPLVGLINDDNITQKFERLKDETDKLCRKDFASVQFAFAHTLSSFIVDAYVTVIIKEFTRVLKHFSNYYEIKNAEEFKNKYLNIPVEHVRELMSLNDTKISKIDSALGQSLKYSILDSYEVQRMDGKGAYTIRKLLRAYLSNPQQLPSEYVNRFIKVEMVRLLDKQSVNQIIENIRSELNGLPENINVWRDYECREALRYIFKDTTLYSLTYDALLRVIFDYISGMTDSYATAQRIELY